MFDDLAGVEIISRRLPIYFVLDSSGSMKGEPIAAVNEGVKVMRDVLMRDPMALETTHISVIEYNSDARQIVPLTDLLSFQPPILVAGHETRLGAALRVLDECLSREIRPNSLERKGDYRALIFIMSDGHTQGGWKKIAGELRARHKSHIASIFALGFGPDVKLDVLQQVADIAMTADNLNSQAISGFFQWVTQSISSASQSIHQTGGGQMQLPPPPAFIRIAPLVQTNP